MNEAKIKTLSAGQILTSGGIEARRLTNDTAYYANVMIDGLRIRRLLGKRSEGFNLARARQAITQLKARANDKDALIQLSGKGAKPLSFEQGATEYLALSTQNGGLNLRQKRQQLTDHLVPHFGKFDLPKITAADVDCYVTTRLDSGAAAGTVCSELAVFTHMFERLAEWGKAEKLKFRCRKPKVENARIERLSSDECIRLIEAAKFDPDPYTHMFVVLGLNTGMRHSEITAIRYDQIDFESKRIYLPKAKNGARHQPFPDQIIQTLRCHCDMLPEPQGWLFPSTSPSGHRAYMTKQFRRTVVRAGLDPNRVTPHVMRHTLITRMVEDGAAIQTIQLVSGHKSPAMVHRYTHVSNQVVTDALDGVAVC